MDIYKVIHHSNILYSFAKSKWKGQTTRDNPYFNQQEYDKWLSEKFQREKKFLTPPEKATEVVASLINDPFAFANFSNTPVVGINYNSYFGGSKIFDTPAAYYAYPIAELTLSTTNFAKKFKYITIIRSNPSKTLIFSQYTREQADSDLKKLKEKFGDINTGNRNIANLPVEIIWNYLYSLSKNNFSIFSLGWIYLGYHVLYDDGFGIVHEGEKRQALFLTPKTDAEIISIFNNQTFDIDRELVLSDVISNDYDSYSANKLLKLIKDQKFDDIAQLMLISNIENEDALKIPMTLLYIYNNGVAQAGRILAKNQGTPPEILQQLANSDNEYIRESVANNPNTLPETLKQLADDDLDFVRETAVSNPNIQPEVIQQSHARNSEYHLVNNPNTPPKTLQQFADSKDPFIRELLAKNPNTPPDILRQLANDHDISIRKNIAKNPNTPQDIIKQLSNINYYEISFYLSSNYNVPPEILDKLSYNKITPVRENVAKNPNTSIDTLQRLSNDHSGEVRIGVAKNPNTPQEILQKLITDDKDISEYLAKEKNTPLEILQQLANSKFETVREYALETLEEINLSNTQIQTPGLIGYIGNLTEQYFQNVMQNNITEPHNPNISEESEEVKDQIK